MNFIIFDLIFLVIFILLATIFLYKNKKNLAKDGPFLLYRTKWGIKLIEKVGTKYQKTLQFLSYISIIVGYILMALIVYFIIYSVWIYITTSVSQVIRAPPIAPLIPYFPQLFGMESFFPPFYFAYFIIAILIVATVHEFSHGIFARKHKIKIKSTGFAFLRYFPVFFGAFVEQDDNQMKRADKFKQMSILGAGVLANILTAILFYIILFVFFTSTFIASGVIFDSYSYSAVPIEDVTTINGVGLIDYSYEEIVDLLDEDSSLGDIQTLNGNYVGVKGFYKEGGKIFLALYDEAPAINSDMGGIITHINGVKITRTEKLAEELNKYSPNETIKITSINENGSSTIDLVLGQHPTEEKGWLGIGFLPKYKPGFAGKLMGLLPAYKEDHVYYEPKNDASLFIKDLLWWVFIINLLVALFNMLPVSALDGGRFFYLTILAITKSKKVAKKSFKMITYFILFLFLILMIKWVTSFI